jgi:hypothetical protein
MKTFLQFISEQSNTGNYASILVVNRLNIPDDGVLAQMHSGIEVPLDKQHVTLVYSVNSNIDPQLILQTLNTEFPREFNVDAVEFAYFDSLPRNGERDSSLSTLVLKLTSPVLEMIHRRLLEIGCTHSYPDYSAHISLYYDVDRDECRKTVEQLNATVKLPLSVKLGGYTSEIIVEDWQTTLSK